MSPVEEYWPAHMAGPDVDLTKSYQADPHEIFGSTADLMGAGAFPSAALFPAGAAQPLVRVPSPLGGELVNSPYRKHWRLGGSVTDRVPETTPRRGSTQMGRPPMRNADKSDPSSLPRLDRFELPPSFWDDYWAGELGTGQIPDTVVVLPDGVHWVTDLELLIRRYNRNVKRFWDAWAVAGRMRQFSLIDADLSKAYQNTLRSVAGGPFRNAWVGIMWASGQWLNYSAGMGSPPQGWVPADAIADANAQLDLKDRDLADIERWMQSDMDAHFDRERRNRGYK